MLTWCVDLDWLITRIDLWPAPVWGLGLLASNWARSHGIIKHCQAYKYDPTQYHSQLWPVTLYARPAYYAQGFRFFSSKEKPRKSLRTIELYICHYEAESEQVSQCSPSCTLIFLLSLFAAVAPVLDALTWCPRSRQLFFGNRYLPAEKIKSQRIKIKLN